MKVLILFVFVFVYSLFCGQGLGFQGLVGMSRKRVGWGSSICHSISSRIRVRYCVETLVGKFTKIINLNCSLSLSVSLWF